MKRRVGVLSLFSFIVLSVASAAGQTPVRINWTAVTGAQSGMFMAKQEGLFKKNGLDVELIHIPSSSRAIQAILAGEIAISFMDGSNAAQANLKGANLALIAGATNRQIFSLMAKPEIKKITELKGKKNRHHPDRLVNSYFGALCVGLGGVEARRRSTSATGRSTEYFYSDVRGPNRRRRRVTTDQR
jgi:NMT1/THI5 like